MASSFHGRAHHSASGAGVPCSNGESVWGMEVAAESCPGWRLALGAVDRLRVPLTNLSGVGNPRPGQWEGCLRRVVRVFLPASGLGLSHVRRDVRA